MARLKICMYILLASLAVSTQEIVLKLAGNRFDPFYFTFLRFLIAAVIILFFAAMLTKRLLQHLDRTAFSLLALNGFCYRHGLVPIGGRRYESRSRSCFI